MKISVRLFVQRHADNTYTIGVPFVPDIAIYGTDFDTCKGQVADALALRFAEIPADQLDSVRMRRDQRLQRVEVELYPKVKDWQERPAAILAVNLLLTPLEDGSTGVTVPRLHDWPLYFIVSDLDRLRMVAQNALALHFENMDDFTAETIEQLQAGPLETLDELEVEFEPQKAEAEAPPRPPAKPAELDQVGFDLTSPANEHWLSATYERDAEVDKVLGVLAGARPSLVLIGPSGAGKTAIMSEVVRRIKNKACPEKLHGRQVWAVTSSSLLAGQKYIGEWEGRLQRVVNEVRERNAILFVEDVAGLVEAGRHDQSNTSMADYLRPFVQNGSVVIVGDSTPERWRYAEQQNAGFVAQLSPIRVEPADDERTVRIVNNILLKIEQRDGIRFAPGAGEVAVDLTNRFMPYRAQPGKSVRLVEQTAGDCLLKPIPEGETRRPDADRKDIAATFTRETGLPEFILADDVPLDLTAVHKHFAERVVGQEDAVDAMVNLIALIKTGLNDPEKPLGSFLFIGPTGVGKTQMVKTLAKYLFGNEERVIRFDMSEYADPFGVRRLLGSPGSGEEGELTGKVREQPFCVLLLDEFEKAAPQIYDLFLQVLGEGRLTGATGATTSFQNAIIVMTSNLGASARDQRAFGLLGDNQSGAGKDQTYWQGKVEDYFRPEFVNRIDQIVPFGPLGPDTMRKIARRELGEVLLRQGVARRNLLVEIDDGIIGLLLEQGFSSAYGARPLKRAIEQRVVVPLARFLAGRTGLGGELLRLGREVDQVTLSVVRVSPEEGREQGLLAAKAPRRAEKDRLLNYTDLIDGFAQLRLKLAEWSGRDAVVEMRSERDARLARTSEPTFWDDPDAAQATLARFYFLERLLKRLQQLADRAAYLEELAGLVQQQRDAGYRWELAENYERLTRDVAFLEVELLGAHIVYNHSAMLTLAPVPRQSQDEDTAAWVRRLAVMYLSWADRKGYDVEAVATLALVPEAQRTTDLLKTYPYRWKRLEVSDCDELIKEVAGLEEVRELAILLSGANVYGFLKGEAGLHRQGGQRGDENRSHGSRSRSGSTANDRGQLFAAVTVDPWDGPVANVLDELLDSHATGKGATTAPSEVVRNYQLEGQRHVRDPRTKARHTDPTAVLAGDLDDFILAYLREIEPENAWEDNAN